MWCILVFGRKCSYGLGLCLLYLTASLKQLVAQIKLFLNGIVSGKVGKRRKVQTIESLSALARVVDIRNMRIPLAVLQHNLKIESSISLPASEHGSDVVFGRPLVRLMGNQGQYGLPKVVSDCLHQLRSFGLQVEGIFRLSPPTSLLRILKDAYDRGQPISLATFHQQPSDERTTSSADAPAHLAAALLKLFLRSLPEPLISQKDYILIEKAPLATFNNGNETIAYLRERLLPHWQSQHSGQAKLLLLASILELLYEISLRASKWSCFSPALCALLSNTIHCSF